MSETRKEVTLVSAEEKKIAENLAEALEKLPPEKQQYFLGYAEGVQAMAERKAAEAEGKNETPAE